MLRRVAVAAALLVPTLALAHWTDHPELPDWAQRGRLRWCLHYSRADRQLVDKVRADRVKVDRALGRLLLQAAWRKLI